MSKQKVLSWIKENFVEGSVKIIDFPAMPSGKRVIDKNGDEILVYYDILTDDVKYKFPEVAN